MFLPMARGLRQGEWQPLVSPLSDTRELKSRDLGYCLYILLLDELQANKVCLSPSIKWRQKSLLLSFAGTW